MYSSKLSATPDNQGNVEDTPGFISYDCKVKSVVAVISPIYSLCLIQTDRCDLLTNSGGVNIPGKSVLNPTL